MNTYQGPHAYGCRQESAQVCLGCGSRVCACYGLARGQCPVCYVGLLSGYYPNKGKPCGYKGCERPATVAVPRKHYACRKHAAERAGYAPMRAEPAPGQLTPYTQTLARSRPDLFPPGALP